MDTGALTHDVGQELGQAALTSCRGGQAYVMFSMVSWRMRYCSSEVQ